MYDHYRSICKGSSRNDVTLDLLDKADNPPPPDHFFVTFWLAPLPLEKCRHFWTAPKANKLLGKCLYVINKIRIKWSKCLLLFPVLQTGNNQAVFLLI